MNIKLLLKRKALKGDELGLATIYTYSKQYIGYRAPITNEEREFLISKLSDEIQRKRYNHYAELMSWTIYNLARMEAYLQQAQVGLCMLITEVSNTLNVEESLNKLEGLLIPEAKDALEVFSVFSPTKAASCENLKMFTQMLKRALTHVLAYNKAIELIWEVLQVSEFLIFKINITPLLDLVQTFNQRTLKLSEQLTGTSEEVAKKQNIITKNLHEIHLVDLAPTKIAVDKIRKLVKDLTIFTNRPLRKLSMS